MSPAASKGGTTPVILCAGGLVFFAVWLRIMQDAGTALIPAALAPVLGAAFLTTFQATAASATLAAAVELAAAFLLGVDFGAVLLVPLAQISVLIARTAPLAAAGLGVATAGALAVGWHNSGRPYDFALLVVVFTLVAVAVALGLIGQRAHHQRDEDQRIVREQRAQLEQDLHRTVASNLSSVVVRLEMLELDNPSLAPHLAPIKEEARRGSSHLRLLLDARAPSVLPRQHPSDLAETVETFTTRLEEHGFTVEVSGFQQAESGATTGEQAVLLKEILDEAGTNILKYGDPEATVRAAALPCEKGLSIEVSNRVRQGVAPEPFGGRGLPTLRARVEHIGGTFEHEEDNGRWLLRAVVP